MSENNERDDKMPDSLMGFPIVYTGRLNKDGEIELVQDDAARVFEQTTAPISFGTFDDYKVSFDFLILQDMSPTAETLSPDKLIAMSDDEFITYVFAVGIPKQEDGFITGVFVSQVILDEIKRRFEPKDSKEEVQRD